MKKKLILLTALLFLATMTSGCWPHTTGSTEVGVRTVKLSLFKTRGVEDHYYAPGSTYWFFPLLNDWHTFDMKLQTMEMTFDPRKGDVRARDDLLFKTIDGNDISLDVIIQYRIKPEMAPHILQNVAASDVLLRQNIVRAVTRSRPRDIFGELKTEGFYISEQRQDKAERARDALNAILEPYGVIVERVSTKDYRFNPPYQKAIEDRKVAEQMAEKNKAAARATAEEYLRKVREAEGEVNQLVAEADGEYRKSELAADAFYQQQDRIAKAITAEGEAEAKGIRAMNEALAGTGGETLVKLKIAESLKGKRIMLLPVSEGGINLKTTDINDLIKVYGLKSMAPKAPAPKAVKKEETAE
jgi:regulator of protease activity HflC (stomatin/prohibitin superfamily)